MVKNKKTKKVEPLRGLGQKERKFLHLKEFSQGKPNELSLNVLEQKVADLDEPPRRFRFWQRILKSCDFPGFSSFDRNCTCQTSSQYICISMQARIPFLVAARVYVKKI